MNLTTIIKLLIVISIILFSGCIGENNNINTNIKYNNEKGLTILVFESDLCAYCKALKPTIEKLKEEGYNIEEIDVNKNKDLAEKFGVRYLPTVIYIKDGKVIDYVIGLKPEEVIEKAKKYK